VETIALLIVRRTLTTSTTNRHEISLLIRTRSRQEESHVGILAEKRDWHALRATATGRGRIGILAEARLACAKGHNACSCDTGILDLLSTSIKLSQQKKKKMLTKNYLETKRRRDLAPDRNSFRTGRESRRYTFSLNYLFNYSFRWVFWNSSSPPPVERILEGSFSALSKPICETAA